jgi:hypothetical protein
MQSPGMNLTMEDAIRSCFGSSHQMHQPAIVENWSELFEHDLRFFITDGSGIEDIASFRKLITWLCWKYEDLVNRENTKM